MALVLRVGGVAEPLLEHVARVVQRPHQRRVIRHVEDVEPVAVARRVHHPIERLVVVHLAGGEPEHRAHRLGDDRPRRPATMSRSRDQRPFSRASNSAAKRSPPPRGRGNVASGTSSSVDRRRARPSRRSRDPTPSPAAPSRAMTRRASYGASPVFIIRCRRCRTMPETVCTIEVNAAIGIT